MKIALYSVLGVLAAYAGGAFLIAFATRGTDLFGVAFLLTALGSIFCHIAALNALRAELARQMFRDLRAIEALLDDKEFDHG